MVLIYKHQEHNSYGVLAVILISIEYELLLEWYPHNKINFFLMPCQYILESCNVKTHPFTQIHTAIPFPVAFRHQTSGSKPDAQGREPLSLFAAGFTLISCTMWSLSLAFLPFRFHKSEMQLRKALNYLIQLSGEIKTIMYCSRFNSILQKGSNLYS